MRNVLFKILLSAAAIAPLLAGPAQADVLLDQAKLIGLPTVAQPSEHAFTATAAEALTVTLKDFQAPAAFVTLQVAVTLGDKLVGSAKVDPTSHTATLPVPAAPGDYVVRVIGTPDATQGIGSFGACVTRDADTMPRTCVAAYSFSGNIQTPATPSPVPSSALNTNFTSTTPGTYLVTITDDAFPVALQKISGGVANGSTPVATLAAGTTQVQITAQTPTLYSLVIGALADATVKAGLYGVRIADPSGAVILDRTVPVGSLPASMIVNNTTAQGFGLTLDDLTYPAALAGVGIAVTQGSTSLAKLTAPGALANFAVPAGSIEIWQYAVAGAQPGVYNVNLSNSTNTLFSNTKVVSVAPAVSAQSFAFLVTLPASGTYNLAVSDFQFPAALTLSSNIAQNGMVLPQSSNGDFTAAKGMAIVVVNAQPPQSGGTGIFDVTVQTSGASPQILLDQTQAVGGVFDTRTVTVGISGAYDATLTDLGFPANFQTVALVVSRGAQIAGKIFGGGTFAFSVTPGSYVLTFAATPDPKQNYGLYAVRVASSAPAVTFTANSASVTVGQPVQLTWSTQNATACTAGGTTGWSGTEPTSGTLAVSIGAAATLTLTCTGPGGSAAKSVSVTVTPAPAKSGGGGSLDLGVLAVLGGWVLARRRPFRTAARVMQR
jgi:hypothetical protein